MKWKVFLCFFLISWYYRLSAISEIRKTVTFSEGFDEKTTIQLSTCPGADGNYESCHFTTSQVLSLTGSTQITMRLCSFSNCRADINAGCVYALESTSVKFFTCTFTSCSSEGNGGCIYQGGDATILLNACKCEECWAVHYGGVICFDGISLTLEADCTFINNSIVRASGGVVCQGLSCFSELLVRNCNFMKCHANDNYGGGGAIFSSSGSLICENSFFDECYCTTSGGTFVFINDGNEGWQKDSKIISCTIRNSNSGRYGGSVTYSTTGCTLTMSLCTIENSYSYQGGSIYVTTWMLLDSCRVIESSSDTQGGGIHQCSGESVVTISNVTALKCVGEQGFVCFDGGTLTIDKSEIIDCVGTGMGGAFCQGDAFASVLTVRDSVIQRCSAGQWNGYGGGALYSSTGESVFENCTFDSCWAVGHGGTIMVNDYYHADWKGDSWIVNSTIINSTSFASGGAIAYETNRTLYVHSLTLTRCSAGESGSAIAILHCDNFVWSKLCINDCELPVVTSPVNVPSKSDLIAGCIISPPFIPYRLNKMTIQLDFVYIYVCFYGVLH